MSVLFLVFVFRFSRHFGNLRLSGKLGNVRLFGIHPGSMLRHTHFGARASDFLCVFYIFAWFLYSIYRVLGQFEGLGFLTNDFLTSVRGVLDWLGVNYTSVLKSRSESSNLVVGRSTFREGF